MECEAAVVRNDAEGGVREQIIKSLVSHVKKVGNGKPLQSCNQGNSISRSPS